MSFIPTLGRSVCAALIFFLPAPVTAQGAPGQPKSVALCLPPGGKVPVPCGTARAGQNMNLVISTTSLPSGPLLLQFIEEAPTGRAPIAARAEIPAGNLNADGSYTVTVPGELCAGAGRSQGQYEIQDLMSSFNQAEGRARSLGVLTVAC